MIAYIWSEAEQHDTLGEMSSFSQQHYYDQSTGNSDPHRRGPQARSACVVCAKGKRRCEGGRPCDRCIRINKAEACLAGIPYETGICRRRRRAVTPQRNSQPGYPEQAKRQKHTEQYTYTNEFSSFSLAPTPTPEIQIQRAPFVDFQILTSETFLVPSQDTPSSARLCAPPRRQDLSKWTFENRKLVLYSPTNFRLYGSAIHLLGYFAENELRKLESEQSACTNAEKQSSSRDDDVENTKKTRWSTRISNRHNKSTLFRLCKNRQLSRYSHENFKNCSKAVPKERLATEALVSLISEGFTMKDIEKMALACISGLQAQPESLSHQEATGTPISSSEIHPADETYPKERTGKGTSEVDGTLMLRRDSGADTGASESGKTLDCERSTITRGQQSTGYSEEDREMMDSNSFTTFPEVVEKKILSRLPSTDGHGKNKDHLLRLVNEVPLDSYMDIPTVPLKSITAAVDKFPQFVYRSLRKLGDNGDPASIHSELADPNLVEILLTWYSGYFDEEMGVGIPGLALEKILRALFNVSHTERIPFYDELLGSMCHSFSRPLVHILYDDDGAPYKIWANSAHLELRNIDADEAASSLGFVSYCC